MSLLEKCLQADKEFVYKLVSIARMCPPLTNTVLSLLEKMSLMPASKSDVDSILKEVNEKYQKVKSLRVK